MRRIIGILLIGLAFWATAAVAQEPGASAWAANDQARVRLVAAAAGVPESGRLTLGIEFRLLPGWKTYWRSPGDAGFPMRVDWEGSTNLARPELQWPAPRRFTLFGLDTFGYGDHVVFPVEAAAADPGAAVALRASVEYLVCEQICVPHTAALALDLPAGGAAPTPFAHEIDRFRAAVPADGAGLAIERASWRGGAAPALLVEVEALEPLRAPELLVEGAPGWSFAAPRMRLGADGRSGRLELAARAETKDAAPPVGATLTLTAIDGMRAREARLAVGPAPVEAGLPATLFAALPFAFLGGLILNLMPCVLPVLALKLLGVVGVAGAAPARVRVGFLASAGGIVATFLALGGALAALAAAGRGVGWGVQFQSPLFLAGMAVLLLAFAANLWGWFTIKLPEFAGRFAARDAGQGPLGSFLAGALATVLATPCSAPFLGTAVGFALAGGAGETLAVFAALGIGMAAPYLAVAAAPGLARALPRPGPWMGRMRAGLGVLLFGTALWLGSIVVLAERGGAPPAGAIAWKPWSRAAIDAALAEGKLVFVDVTAEWCITCRVNKSFTLERADVAALLAAPDVVVLQADWTRPDPRIADYLAGFGRYGIPFDAVYGPGRPGGEALPEILTPDAVRAALARARKP